MFPLPPYGITPEIEQIDRLQDLCIQAEHAYYAYSEAQCDSSEFAAVISKIKDELNIAEKLWGTTPPATKEMNLLLKRLETLLLLPRPFDLKGMSHYKEILKIFHSVLPTQNRVPFLCVNRDWSGTFTTCEDIDTHEKVTVQLEHLSDNLIVLDTHLDKSLNRKSADYVRSLTSPRIQKIVQPFSCTHHSSRQKCTVFDFEDIEADIKDILAEALNTLESKTLEILFSSIQKKHLSAFFQDLKTLTECYKKIHESNDPQATKSRSLNTLISVKAFKKIYGWIVANDLGNNTWGVCHKLLLVLTKAGRYKEVFTLARILITNPEQLHLTKDEGRAICLMCIQTLCKQMRFNKAFEALQIVLIEYEKENDGFNIIIDSLTTMDSLKNNGFYKKAIAIALQHPNMYRRIELLSSIVGRARLLEKKKFQEVAEIALSIKAQLSDGSLESPIVNSWFLYAKLIQGIPEKFLQEVGIQKTEELKTAAIKLLKDSTVHGAQVRQILNWIPAEEIEAHQRIQALSGCSSYVRERAFEIMNNASSDGWFSPKLIDMALMGESEWQRIQLIFFIAENSQATEKKEFAAAAQLVRLLKKEILNWSSEYFSSDPWFKYAALIHKTPQEFLQEVGIDKMEELERATTTILQKSMINEEIVEQIFDWIPAEETKARQRIEDLLSNRRYIQGLISRPFSKT